MNANEAYEAIITTPGTRISRRLADATILTAQTYGYAGIELSDGGTLQVRFDDDGFTVTK